MMSQPDAPRDDASMEPQSAASPPEGTPQETDLAPPSGAAGQEAPGPRKQRVLIGSQRDRGSVTRRAQRDWYVPGEEPDEAPGESAEAAESKGEPAVEAPPEPSGEVRPQQLQPEEPRPEEPQPPEAAAPRSPVFEPETFCEPETFSALEPTDELAEPASGRRGTARRFPPPNRRSALPAELEAELEAALGDASLEDLLVGSESVTREAILEPDARRTGRVVAVERDNVFVDLGGREQGVVPLASFAEAPAVGAIFELVVVRYMAEDGLYELRLPHAAAAVGDWSDLAEGMVVDARVTGHNAGGLECEVNHIRGFIPASQIALYHVEDLAEFVGEKLTCLVTEANPQRRNLVLSRRAVLEREREEARQALLGSLAPGQIHEGIVRKLMDFGAFVDLGGVDGLLHISQLGWSRVNHPSDVLAEGQRIRVKIQKVDLANNRISLGYREMLDNPWDNVAQKYPVSMVLKGKVTKLMQFGAFVELEPGVEGLVHISELSHKRVFRTSDVVAEGDEVEVMVKSVDAEAQRIGLSMKDVLPAPETAKPEEPTDEELAAAMPKPSPRRSNKPLRGGRRSQSGGEQFGLKW